MNKDILLILDLKHPAVSSIKDLELCYQHFPGLNLFLEIYKEFLLNNIEVILKSEYYPNLEIYKNKDKLLIITEPNFSDLFFYINNKVRLFACFCGEAPINSLSYHLRLPIINLFFENIIGFKGVNRFLIGKSNLFTLNWPMSDRKLSDKLNFEERKLLAYVASAKSKYPFSERYLISFKLRKLRFYVNSLIKLITFNFFGKDISSFRFHYIHTLSNQRDFFLFGKSWDFALRKDPFYSGLKFYNLPSEVSDKLKLLGEFRFHLCFENTLFEGYVTEKIFDSMSAGCVPIYLGCQIPEDLVPSSCYINANMFSSPMALLSYLRDFKKDDWIIIQENINSFLCSDQFKRNYLDKSIATKIFKFV